MKNRFLDNLNLFLLLILMLPFSILAQSKEDFKKEHFIKDDVVPPEYSKTMARVINSNGGNAKLSLYPNDNHNSWDSAFAEPELLPWLFNQTKNKK